jgi:ethanolamine ammonia-lyase small subunit
MDEPPADPFPGPPAAPPAPAAAGPLWRDLRRFTTARVALGRAGNGLPTEAHLAFQAAHAAARDAVHAEIDFLQLSARIGAEIGVAPRVVRSLCPDRRSYLLRPDLGRALDPVDRTALAAEPAPGAIAFVICDGLSAMAVERNAAPLLSRVAPALGGGPVVLAAQARVALGDAVGEALQAEAVVVLIGERPGLSSPDSLGVYLTWAPRVGRSDAERNCISNIRAEGLAVPAAAEKLLWLIGEMRRLRCTGVALKDEQPEMVAVEAAVESVARIGAAPAASS